MPRITVGNENGSPIEIHYEDHGSGRYAYFMLTDVRDDLRKIDIPTLVVHGTDDRILPFRATAARLPGLIADVKLVRVEGGPHNIGWTHPEAVDAALLGFLADTATALKSAA